MVFPALDLVYTLVRGRFVDWYPYRFFDPGREGGYWTVTGFTLIILVDLAAIASFLAWWPRRGTEEPPADGE